jgi:hypothetical protein
MTEVKEVRKALQTTKINNVAVKGVKHLEEEDKRPVKGAELISELFANVGIVAQKMSGKTSLIATMLEHCVGRDTQVLLFVSTLHSDKSWLAITDWMDRKGIPWVGQTSIYGDTRAHNLLKEWVRLQQDEAKARIDAEKKRELEGLEKKAKKAISCDSDTDSDEEETKKRKTKYKAPDWIVILDDLSDELRDPAVAALMKKNRHLKCKVIMSTQYLHDVVPSALKQLQVWILFKGHVKEKLQKFWEQCGTQVVFETFLDLYKDATSVPYGFLYIDTVKDEFRSGFDKLYSLRS